ncbi:MAG: hypothetical protein KDC09_12655 [Bacteroidales bacterium]|nr:hypothetical protein [Bacteroidales bacterium]
MNNSPAYYRARIAAFEKVIREEKGGERDEKNNHSVILRNGVIPAGFKNRIHSLIQENQKNASNAKLSFEEITRFNTWFEIHPEKVAGTEFITTSREFPIMIKGTEEDIIRTVSPTSKPDKNEKRVQLAKAKAMARKRILELMNLK